MKQLDDYSSDSSQREIPKRLIGSALAMAFAGLWARVQAEPGDSEKADLKFGSVKGTEMAL